MFKKGHKVNLGRKFSTEIRRKIGVAHKGKVVSSTTRNKIKDTLTGRKASKETRKKMSETRKRLYKDGLNHAMLGRNHTKESRLAISKATNKRVTDGTHNLYKGGLTNKNSKIRQSFNYKVWREAVFERDNFTCQACEERGGRLNADHIKPFAYFPQLRFELANGRTLCESCHKKTNTFGRRARLIYEI